MTVSCDSDRDRNAIKSWFSPLCDEMSVVSAEILCDRETDEEKKFRAIMLDTDGKERVAIRARTKTGWTLTLKTMVG
jgi:hypothetical protein